MDQGFIDNQGNGFAVWTVPNTGIGSRLLVQSFQHFKSTGTSLELSNQARDQHGLSQREGDGAITWLDYETPEIPEALQIRTIQQGKVAASNQRLHLPSEIGQALISHPFAVSLNAQGDGVLIWQQGTHRVLSQKIQHFALIQTPSPVAESAQALQMKVSLDTQGNGIVNWVERTSSGSHILRSRAVLNYQPL